MTSIQERVVMARVWQPQIKPRLVKNRDFYLATNIHIEIFQESMSK
jgi:hypothetical protein